MELEGGCYCGEVRYKTSGDAIFKGQCHCRECQYASGGAPNVVMGMPAATFEWTKGEPKGFTRTDIENAVTREFCANCGTQLVTRVPGMPAALLKVGTLDDPSAYGMPGMAIFLCDSQEFHQVPEGVATFDRGPS